MIQCAALAQAVVIPTQTSQIAAMATITTRFAPSPTGYLHLGHAYSARCAYDAARNAGGRMLLRIEDIDAGRCRPEFEQAIYEDLTWLGLRWDPPVRRQSDHLDDYEAALNQLREQGLVYRCFKTRKQVAEAIASAPHYSAGGPQGAQYVGAPLEPDQESEKLAAGEPFAWRLSIARSRDFLGADFDRLFFIEDGAGPRGETGEINARPEIFGDAIVARKDAPTSYHLAVAHDDHLQSVSHVVRGKDLFFSTHLHRLLQALLGWTTPIYRHHPLAANADGVRWAKRRQAPTLRNIRKTGVHPTEIFDQVNII